MCESPRSPSHSARDRPGTHTNVPLPGGPAMTPSWMLILFLGVICLAVLIMDALLVHLMLSMRRTLTKLDTLLPACHRTVREANELLARTNRVTRDVETVVQKARAMVGGALNHLHAAKTQAELLLTGLTGNGTKPGRFRRRAK